MLNLKRIGPYAVRLQSHFSTSKKCKKNYSIETYTNCLALNQYTHIWVGCKKGFQPLKIMRFDGPVLFHLLLQTQVTTIVGGNRVPLLSTTSNLQCMPQTTNQKERGKEKEFLWLCLPKLQSWMLKGTSIYRHFQGLVCVTSHDQIHHPCRFSSWEIWDLTRTQCQVRYKGCFHEPHQVYKAESAKISGLQHYPTHFLLRCSFIIGNSFWSRMISVLLLSH